MQTFDYTEYRNEKGIQRAFIIDEPTRWEWMRKCEAGIQEALKQGIYPKQDQDVYQFVVLLYWIAPHAYHYGHWVKQGTGCLFDPTIEQIKAANIGFRKLFMYEIEMPKLGNKITGSAIKAHMDKKRNAFFNSFVAFPHVKDWQCFQTLFQANIHNEVDPTKFGHLVVDYAEVDRIKAEFTAQNLNEARNGEMMEETIIDLQTRLKRAENRLDRIEKWFGVEEGDDVRVISPTFHDLLSSAVMTDEQKERKADFLSELMALQGQ